MFRLLFFCGILFFVFSSAHADHGPSYDEVSTQCEASVASSEASPSGSFFRYYCSDGPNAGNLSLLRERESTGDITTVSVYSYATHCESAGDRSFGGEGALPTSICSEGCSYELAGVGGSMGGFYAGGFSATGAQCSGAGDGASPGQNCVQSNGDTLCFDPVDSNCGVFNGELICLDDIPVNDCVTALDGGVYCGQSSPTPPVPDNGVPGVSADPDNQITVAGDAPDVDYYSGGTVADSSTSVDEPVGGGGEVDGGDVGGDTGGDTGGDVGEPEPEPEEFPAPPGIGDNFGALDGLISDIMGLEVNAPPAEAPSRDWSVGGGGECTADSFPLVFQGIDMGINICPAIDLVRDILYWFFAGLASIFVFKSWSTAHKGA